MDDCENCTVAAKLDLVLDQLAIINRAFPDGPESHRLVHENLIRAAVAEEKFWTELKLDIVKKGVWGLLIIVIGLAIIGISAKFGIAVVK